ncbi:MAG: hypothetical protein N2594_06400 [Clostridiales bacterium]|nr:hypothetical protein [Clostridiales bacterium]
MANLDMPIYLNKNMILDLYSTVINGYIESKEDMILNSQDNFSKVLLDNKITNSCDNKRTDENDKNNVLDIYKNNTVDLNSSQENRLGSKVQTRVKRIYSTFNIFNSLKQAMNNLSIIKPCDNYNSLNVGDFIELHGTISSNNLIPQIETIMYIFECYDTKVLNKLLPTDDPKYQITTFDFLYNELKTLYNDLNRNNTNNLVVINNSFKCALNVNNTFFLDKSTYIYDYVNCNCKALCKVSRKLKINENINLLSKTCADTYYVEFFNLLQEYLDILKSHGIIVPQRPDCLVEYPAICATPIAMYI